MKTFIVCILAVLTLSPIIRADEANGIRLTAQKITLERDKDRGAFATWEHFEKALALKITAKNLAFKPKPEGKLQFTIIVRRWGSVPARYESFTGSDKFPALLPSEETSMTLGKVPLAGYSGVGLNRKDYQDTIEGWQVIVTHEEKETIKMTSTSSFDKLLKKATPGATPK